MVAGDLRVPPNVDARGFVAHTEVMLTVSLLIGHGGHATTMLALAHDLPLLVVPQHAIDQPMIGQAVASQGAGLVVEPQAPVEHLREAITALLSDDAYGRSAAASGARLRRQDGAACAADRIEALVGVSVPL